MDAAEMIRPETGAQTDLLNNAPYISLIATINSEMCQLTHPSANHVNHVLMLMISII